MAIVSGEELPLAELFDFSIQRVHVEIGGGDLLVKTPDSMDEGASLVPSRRLEDFCWGARFIDDEPLGEFHIETRQLAILDRTRWKAAARYADNERAVRGLRGPRGGNVRHSGDAPSHPAVRHIGMSAVLTDALQERVERSAQLRVRFSEPRRHCRTGRSSFGRG